MKKDGVNVNFEVFSPAISKATFAIQEKVSQLNSLIGSHQKAQDHKFFFFLGKRKGIEWTLKAITVEEGRLIRDKERRIRVSIYQNGIKKGKQKELIHMVGKKQGRFELTLEEFRSFLNPLPSRDWHRLEKLVTNPDVIEPEQGKKHKEFSLIAQKVTDFKAPVDELEKETAPWRRLCADCRCWLGYPSTELRCPRCKRLHLKAAREKPQKKIDKERRRKMKTPNARGVLPIVG